MENAGGRAVGPVIDSVAFAREGQTLSGEIAVAALQRLADSVQPAGRLTYQVSGMLDGQGRAHLWVKVAGQVQLQCQRCMGELQYQVHVDSTLRLLPTAQIEALERQGGEALSDPDEPDYIAASSSLDIAALVEDEVLLELPPYPRHEDACAGEGGQPPATVEKEHTAFGAFGALQALKPALDAGHKDQSVKE